MFKKLIFSILSALVLFQATASYAIAAQPQPATWYNQGIQEWYLKVFDESVSPPEEIFGERYTAAQVDWIIWSFLTWLPTKILNPDGTACLIGIFNQVFTGQGLDWSNCKDKIFGFAPDQLPKYADVPQNPNQNLLSLIFSGDRPLSGIGYVKNLASKMTSVQTANAQGFGYTTALSPFRLMWTASRDIAYSLFVFAAIILAFMVMFRVKLNPQTAVTVQSAIPKLIIGLILVTFSYAIAGFMVDLMYVVFGLLSIVGVRFLPLPGGSNPNPALVYNFMTIGPYLHIPGLNIDMGVGLYGLFFFYLLFFAIAFIVVGLLTFGVVGAGLLAALTGLGIALLSATGIGIIALLLFFIIFVIIIIAVFVMIFKTTFAIIKAFANIILLTIFAPFQLLAGTFIPSMGFGSWVRSFASNLGVFVGVSFMFLLATIFLWQAMAAALDVVQTGLGSGVFNAIGTILFGGGGYAAKAYGATTQGWPPLMVYGPISNNAASTAGFYLIFSFVLFMQIPKTADMIKSFISGRPWSYGSAIGEGLAAGGLIGAAYSRSGLQNAVGTSTKLGQQNMWGGIVNKAADWASEGRPGSLRERSTQRLRDTANAIKNPPKA